MLRYFMILAAAALTLAISALFVPYASMAKSVGASSGLMHFLAFVLLCWGFSKVK